MTNRHYKVIFLDIWFVLQSVFCGQIIFNTGDGVCTNVGTENTFSSALVLSLSNFRPGSNAFLKLMLLV